ncbi:MAG: hypothetical protein WDO69_02510 [Pseudomonadota bacterium]
MPKPFKEWTVLPHGKLSRLDDNLLSVSGDLHMPVGDFPRRMTVVRLHDGRLVVYSAIALDEVEMHALEAFGEPSYLVIPNDIHRMDAKIWKDRYPQMCVVAPAGVRKQVEEVVPVEETAPNFGDPQVQFVAVPGTQEREAALVVRTWSGTTLVVNDLIWNLDDRPGFGGWLFHLLGFTGQEPRIPALVERRGIKDKHALRGQLERWARIPGLNRIIVSHGKIVSRDAAGVLDRLAESLAA